MEITTDIYLGDSKEQLKLLKDNSVDLIVTSPPYADQRRPKLSDSKKGSDFQDDFFA